MPRRGKRKLLAPNIYQDGTGYAVIVRVGGKPDEHRFPPGTPFERLEATRETLLLTRRKHARPRAGSLAADAQDYLKTLGDAQTRKFATILCGHWTVRYGHESRFALTRLVIEQQLAEWQHAGVAASTCNKRLSALRSLFNAVNTDADPNPTARVKKRPEPPPEPRALDYAVIERILAHMPDRGKPSGQGKGTRPTVSLSKLRCALSAYTGLPPAQIMRINPQTDILWDERLLRARPRRKGRGTKEDWLPLMPQAISLLRALDAADALGQPYSTASLRMTWQRACAKVIAEQLEAREPPLPHRVVARKGRLEIVALVRPYDLRHSFLTWALQASGNMAGVTQLAQHADSRTTRRYVMGGLHGAATAVTDAMTAGRPAPPVPPRRRRKAKGDGTP